MPALHLLYSLVQGCELLHASLPGDEALHLRCKGTQEDSPLIACLVTVLPDSG